MRCACVCVCVPIHAEVDAWCLGFSVFQLLAGVSLFQSSDPASNDVHWADVARGALPELLRLRAAPTQLSHDAEDFVRGLLDLNPSRRMSVLEALRRGSTVGSMSRPSS